MTPDEEARLAACSLLGTLGITSLDEWAVLQCLTRQPHSSFGLDELTRQTGQDCAQVGKALQRLETQGLLLHTCRGDGEDEYCFVQPRTQARSIALTQLLRLEETVLGRNLLERTLGRVQSSTR